MNAAGQIPLKPLGLAGPHPLSLSWSSLIPLSQGVSCKPATPQPYPGKPTGWGREGHSLGWVQTHRTIIQVVSIYSIQSLQAPDHPMANASPLITCFTHDTATESLSGLPK